MKELTKDQIYEMMQDELYEAFRNLKLASQKASKIFDDEEVSKRILDYGEEIKNLRNMLHKEFTQMKFKEEEP